MPTYKYLTPLELFEIRRKAGPKMTEGSNLRSADFDASIKVQELLSQQEEPEEFGLGDAAKTGLGKIVSGLDYVGSLARHGIREVAETAGLKENTEGLTAGEILRSTDEADAAVKNMRATVGIDPNAGGRVAGLFDTILMAATDPLSAVTFGTGAAAKTALGTIARTAGDDVAEAIARGGIRAGDEVLATRAPLVTREAVPAAARPTGADIVRYDSDFADNQVADWLGERGGVTVAGTPRTVRDILEEAADTGLAQGNLDDVVARQLSNLERRGRGGLGFAGLQTGIGAQVGSEAAGRAREALLPLTRLLSPTADVAAELGRPAAEAVDVAIHTGGNVRREQRRLLADQLEDPTELSGQVRLQAERAMATDLAELAGDRLVSMEARPGWVKLAEDQYVPKVVKDALDQSVRKPSGPLLGAVDKGISALKRYTTLGPLNAIPHVSRNMVSNKLFASLFGGVSDPRYYAEARNLRKALQTVSEDARLNGGLMLERELVDLGLEGMDVRRALAIHDQQLAGRGGSAFDDVDIDGRLSKESGRKEGLFGTRTAARVNQYDEELTRGAVFLKGLDEGLDPRLAARKSRHALLDYTDEGLSDFERNVMQRVMFFYKFPRRSIPTGVEFMARYPGLADAISEAGLGVAQGTRNEYNEKIGPYLDTPLEATVGGIAELFSDPLGGVNPLLKAAGAGLSGNEVEVGKALPPLGQLQRLFQRQAEGQGPFDREGGFSTGAPGPYGVGALLGFREGRDYGQERWTEDRDRRIVEDGEPSKTDQLIALADEAGVEDPYEMSDAQLVKALVAKRVPTQTIAQILRGE